MEQIARGKAVLDAACIWCGRTMHMMWKDGYADDQQKITEGMTLCSTLRNVLYFTC